MLIQYRVALRIVLEESTGRKVTEHLGVQPTKIHEATLRSGKPGGKITVQQKYFWQLDSPKGEIFEPIVRLDALVNLIAPFSEKLISLDSRYRRMVDLVVPRIAQRADGRITGAFDWFMISPSIMSKLGAWDLLLSYETFWFDNPERSK
jgi:hypothetical protein